MSTASTTLPEFDHPPADPITLVRQWFAAAADQEVREPGAMALATADSGGHSSVRTVALLGVPGDGLIFTSHAGSVKGREMAETGWASAVLYWRETHQQVTVAGPVERLPGTESDELWASRPAATHPMSSVSEQSSPLHDEETLRTEAEHLARSAEPLPRPRNWAGYRLTPSTVEFWQASPDRLHRRLRYDRAGSGWTAQRLQP